ncbi:alpha/beta fold hydrolase [Rhodobacterales bacterium HKCCE2091]|nr:alpha/beta fold hydrolase [Rhodobacterales bacterium HKCCE2091]
MSDLDGFTETRVATNGIELSVHRAGSGPAVVLLHGFPQTHACWSRIAPALARDFDVIVPDLRGYGASDAPEGAAAYAKREMAKDVVGLLDALGIDRAAVVGHDRGARVTYRLALDHPGRVSRIAILEIVPTGDFWAAWSADLAMAAYHWTFLAQPAPLPERMILADGPGYIDWCLSHWTLDRDLSPFPRASLEAYRAQGADPARVAAMCNDYRAGATIDRQLDEADRTAGHRIAAPILFLWAENGFPARTGDPLGLWRAWGDEVEGRAIPGTGHFMPEEAPDAVLDALRPFLGAPGVG